MADGDFRVEGGEGAGKGGGGVAVDQHKVRLRLPEYVAHLRQNLCGDGGQRLPRLHDVEVVIRLYAEDIQDAVQHLPVLGRDADQALKFLPPLQLQGEGAHLDGLGPCSEDGEYTQLFHDLFSSCACSGGRGLAGCSMVS